MVILIVTTVVIDCGNLAWELRPFAFKNSLIISLIHLDEFGKFNIPTENAFTSTELNNKHLVTGHWFHFTQLHQNEIFTAV